MSKLRNAQRLRLQSWERNDIRAQVGSERHRIDLECRRWGRDSRGRVEGAAAQRAGARHHAQEEDSVVIEIKGGIGTGERQPGSLSPCDRVLFSLLKKKTF